MSKYNHICVLHVRTSGIYGHICMYVVVRESVPRQIDKKSRTPEEEIGV